MTILLMVTTAVLHLDGNYATANDKFSALGFNQRKDVGVWVQGMASLGGVQGSVIRGASPSLADMKSLFGRSDEWLYLAGHYSGGRLYNEDDTVSVTFEKDRVILRNGATSEELRKDQGFKQHLKLKVVFWGGCNTQGDDETVKMLRALFGANVIQVGWKGITGWEMPMLNMGGKIGDKQFETNFFSLMGGSTDVAKVKDAWLNSADKIYWGKDGNGAAYRPRFAVIDGSGQQHLLKGEVEINKGQSLGKQY